MQNKLLIASVLAATAMFTVAGCSSNQAVKPPMAKRLLLTGNRRWMTIPVWYRTKTPKPVKLNRLTATGLNQWVSWITKSSGTCHCFLLQNDRLPPMV